MAKPKPSAVTMMLAGASIAGGNGVIAFNNGNTTLGVASLVVAGAALALIPVAKRRQERGQVEITGVRFEPVLIWLGRLALLFPFAALLIGLFAGLPAYFRNYDDLTFGWEIGFWALIAAGICALAIDGWRRRIGPKLVVGLLFAALAMIAKETTLVADAAAAVWQANNPAELRLIYAVDSEAGLAATPALLTETQARMARYLAMNGQFHPPEPLSGDRIALHLAAIDPYDLDDIKGVLSAGYLGFHLVHDESDDDAPSGLRRIDGVDGALVVETAPVLTSADIPRAWLGTTPYGEPAVNLVFEDESAARLELVTAANVGRRLALVFKNRVLMAPVIRAPIAGGEVQVTGSFESDEAFDLVGAIARGGLPLPMVLVEESLIE